MNRDTLGILEEVGVKEESKELVKETGSVLSESTTLAITDDGTFHLANELLKDIKRIRKEIDEYFDPAIKKAHATWKENIAMKKRQSEPIDRAERILKDKISVYHNEQRRKRLEEERKRRKELIKQEEERRLLEAEETGDESILEEPIVVPEVKEEDTTRHEGISYQKIWKFRIVDKEKVPEEYKIVDENAVGQVVRAMKENTNIPGIEAYPEEIVKAKA